MLQVGDLVHVKHLDSMGNDLSFDGIIDYFVEPYVHVRSIGKSIYAGGFQRPETLTLLRYEQMAFNW